MDYVRAAMIKAQLIHVEGSNHQETHLRNTYAYRANDVDHVHGRGMAGGGEMSARSRL